MVFISYRAQNLHIVHYEAGCDSTVADEISECVHAEHVPLCLALYVRTEIAKVEEINPSGEQKLDEVAAMTRSSP